MTTRFLISLTLASVILPSTPCLAQSTGGDNAALLQEVRLLRLAIETLAGTNARVQIVFGRLQLQEQRTAATARRLDDVRAVQSGRTDRDDARA